jgi:hypothetical protein
MQKKDAQILTGLKKARTHLAKVIAMVEAGEFGGRRTFEIGQ